MSNRELIARELDQIPEQYLTPEEDAAWSNL
jgi:hypothetical protein